MRPDQDVLGNQSGCPPTAWKHNRKHTHTHFVKTPNHSRQSWVTVSWRGGVWHAQISPRSYKGQIRRITVQEGGTWGREVEKTQNAHKKNLHVNFQRGNLRTPTTHTNKYTPTASDHAFLGSVMLQQFQELPQVFLFSSQQSVRHFLRESTFLSACLWLQHPYLLQWLSNWTKLHWM